MLHVCWNFCVAGRTAGSLDLPVGPLVDRRVESYFCFSEKYFRSHLTQITFRTLAVSSHRGAYRDRHERGAGCGGRGSVLHATRSQGGFFESVSGRKHADERCCCVRRSRVVLTPRRWRQVRGCYVGPTGLRHNVNPRTTVANKPGHRRARRKPLKPLRAGTPGDSGVLVYSCAFYQCQAHTRLRVPRAPGVPHALFGRKIYQRLGRIAPRGEVADACLGSLKIESGICAESVMTLEKRFALSSWPGLSRPSTSFLFAMRQRRGCPAQGRA